MRNWAWWVAGVASGAVPVASVMGRRHRRVVTALRDERNRLTLLAETAPSVIVSFRLTADGRWCFPYTTHRIEEIFGLRAATASDLGTELRTRIHPEDLDEIAQVLEESARMMEPFRHVFRVNHPSRGEILVEGHSMPVREEDGGVTWHGTLTDVTDRWLMEHQLRERERLLEETGRLAEVGGWEWDVVDGVGRWTQEVARMHGLPEDAPADPSSILGLYVGDSREQLRVALEAAVARAEPYELELELEAADGTRKWIRTIGRPVLRDGVVVRVRGALQDITRQKTAEAAMKDRLALQERLSVLAAASPGVIYAFRLDPHGRMSLPLATRQLEDLFGVADLEQDAEPILQRIHPDDAARVRERILESARTLAPWAEEFRYLHPTRGQLWLEGRAAPAPQADGGVLWHGFIFDIGQRKLLEEQFRQAQKMEAIGQLAGGVAHDFNNLLTVILGNATLLGMSSLPAPEAEHTEEITRAATRAADLTRQLLLVSRRQVLHRVPLDLNDAIGSMIRLLGRLLGESVHLHPELAPGLPPVLADPGMLGQVLLNLAVNARDAMPAGGTLVIRTALVDEGFTPTDGGAPISGPCVCLTVSDTGSGMSDDVLERIFQPFITTKAPGKGTGLGLATVYGIVRQHGGAISVSSQTGAGSTFRIALPAASENPVPVPVMPGGLTAALGGAAVLVVEDEPSVRQLTAGVLEQAGYRVLTASTGRAALDLFHQERDRIEAVITDIVMPDGMSGYDLARILHQEVPGLPVIYTSGYSADAEGGELTLSEGINFLQKPYQLSVLTHVVRQALERRAQQSGAS